MGARGPRFLGRTAVVTGGSGGLGRAVCEGLAAEGAVVADAASVDEAVDPVLFLAGDESSYVTGMVLDVNGGRFMPL